MAAERPTNAMLQVEEEGGAHFRKPASRKSLNTMLTNEFNLTRRRISATTKHLAIGVALVLVAIAAFMTMTVYIVDSRDMLVDPEHSKVRAAPAASLSTAGLLVDKNQQPVATASHLHRLGFAELRNLPAGQLALVEDVALELNGAERNFKVLGHAVFNQTEVDIYLTLGYTLHLLADGSASLSHSAAGAGQADDPTTDDAAARRRRLSRASNIGGKGFALGKVSSTSESPDEKCRNWDTGTIVTSEADCFCKIQDFLTYGKLKVSRSAYTPSGQFSQGGCSACGLPAPDDAHTMPLYGCKCANGEHDTASGTVCDRYMGSETACANLCANFARQGLFGEGGDYKTTYSANTMYQQGSCTCCGNMDPCKVYPR